MLQLRPKTRLDQPDEFAWVCYAMAGICALTHLLLFGNRDAVHSLGFAPTGAAPYTFVTSIFVHASWWHLISNMLFLLVFGPPVEKTIGHRGTLLLYLGSAIAGHFVRFVLDGGSTIPAVGASGAICGLLGAYGYIFRRERTDLLFGPWWWRDLWSVECSVLTTVLVFFLGQLGLLLLTAAAGISTGVGYGAHVVGLLVGLASGVVISKQREATLARWRREHAPDIPCPTCAGEARFAVDDLYRCRACGKWTHGPRPEEAAGVNGNVLEA